MEELIELKVVLAIDWENRKVAVRSCRQAGAPRQVSKATKTRDTEAFERFWGMYPRRENKRAAESAFYRAAERVSEVSVIFEGLGTSPRLKREKQYVPHATTWLNGNGWEDEPESTQKQRVY